MTTAEEGDFVRFTITDKDRDRLTASGYIQRIIEDVAFVRFNDREYLAPVGSCDVICKQYKLDV